MGTTFKGRHAATAALIAGALALTGCAAETGAAGADATVTATETPSAVASAPVTAAPTEAPRGPNPLDSIPEEPYGYSLDELRAVISGAEVTVDVEGGPLTYTAFNQMNPEEASFDFSGALQLAFQLDWVGAQRDTVFNGWRMENVRGNIDDINHFIAPSALEHFLPNAQRQLKAAEEREKGGEATTYSEEEYALHVGKMASDYETDAAVKAQWPDHQDAVVWVAFSGEGQPDQVIPVPRDAKATWSAPVVTELSSTGQDDLGQGIIVFYTNTATVVLADGQSAQMTIERNAEVTMEDGAWRMRYSNGTITQTTLVP